MERLLVDCAVRAALMVVVTAVILSATRIKTPSVLHTAWTAVLLSMLLLPLWTMWGPRASLRVLLPAPVRREHVPAPSVSVPRVLHGNGRPPETAEFVAQTQHPNWHRVLLGLYLMIVSALLARLAIGTVRTLRLIRDADRRDGTLTSAWCAVPITVGWFRPVVILPEPWQDWPAAQLDAVLVHESEHARRRDPLVQWLALLNRAIFWFHPLAWWLERRLATLAEDACDAAVLARGHDAGNYADYLLDIARAATRAGSRVLVVGTAMPGPHLARRVQRMLTRSPAPQISRTRLTAVLAACTVSSAMCASSTLEPAHFMAGPGGMRRLAVRKASTELTQERRAALLVDRTR